MALGQEVKDALRLEMAELRAEIAALERRADALREILGESDDDSDGASNETLRHLLVALVRAQPGRPAAHFSRLLRERGFRVSGKTDLHHRVYNELWRLSKIGALARTAEGGFVVRDDGEPDPADDQERR